ncbi:hypothetical protein FOZ60_013915 [Perkinsus olseni]|uniref:Uncharacterized protein n=1 Tax=Perkinsus olseni TaxID=32597 RepID=A0A7J6P7U5_PEROL|nr:hypothetical protein FOZ60_013915 [Perkinsus olseni]
MSEDWITTTFVRCLAEVKELSRIAVDENRDRAFDATKHFMESAAIQCKATGLETAGMGTGKGREYFQGEYEKQMNEELMVKLADAAVLGLARDFDEVKARLRDEVVRMVGEEVHLSYANQWRDEIFSTAVPIKAASGGSCRLGYSGKPRVAVQFERLRADVTMKMVREEVANAMDQHLEEASDKMQRRFEAAVDGLKVDMCDRASVAGMVEEARQEWSEGSTKRFDEVSRALADVHDRLQGHAQQLRGEITSSQAKVLGVLAETGDELARRIELQSSSPPQVGGDTQSQLSEEINKYVGGSSFRASFEYHSFPYLPSPASPQEGGVLVERLSSSSAMRALGLYSSIDGAELRVVAAERKLSVLEEKLTDAENSLTSTISNVAEELDAATAENTESIAKLKESVGGLEDAIEGTAGSLEASEGRLLKEIGDKAGREEVEGLLRRVKAEAKAPTGPPVDTSAAPELSEITTQLERQLREGLEPLEGNLKDLEARTEARMKGFNVKMEDARKALEENTESIGNRIDSLDLRVSKLEVPSEKTTGPSLDTSTNPVKDTAFEEDIHELRRRMIDVEGLRSEVEVVRRDFQEAARPLLGLRLRGVKLCSGPHDDDAHWSFIYWLVSSILIRFFFPVVPVHNEGIVVDAGAPSENSSSLMQQLVETCLQWRSEIQKARTSMREQREGSEEVQEALDDCRDRVDALMRDVEAAVGEISRWVAQRRPSEETEIERMFLRIHDEVITEKPLRLVDAARDLCAELSRIRPPVARPPSGAFT